MNIPKTKESVKYCTQQDGIALCKLISEGLNGYYPALTGGLLYKEGNRKDIDIIIYRNRQSSDSYETTDIKEELSAIGVNILQCYGFVTKALWNGFSVDIFNPETKIVDLEDMYSE